MLLTLPNQNIFAFWSEGWVFFSRGGERAAKKKKEKKVRARGDLLTFCFFFSFNVDTSLRATHARYDEPEPLQAPSSRYPLARAPRAQEAEEAPADRERQGARIIIDVGFIDVVVVVVELEGRRLRFSAREQRW